MNDYVDNVKIEGDVILDGEDIYDSRVDTTLLRKKVGMVFLSDATHRSRTSTIVFIISCYSCYVNTLF